MVLHANAFIVFTFVCSGNPSEVNCGKMNK